MVELSLGEEAGNQGLKMGQKFMIFPQVLQMEDPIQLKEEGNKYFQASDYEKALQSYTQAIKLNKDKALQAVLYRNRAACFLKKVRKAPLTWAVLKGTRAGGQPRALTGCGLGGLSIY